MVGEPVAEPKNHPVVGDPRSVFLGIGLQRHAGIGTRQIVFPPRRLRYFFGKQRNPRTNPNRRRPKSPGLVTQRIGMDAPSAQSPWYQVQSPNRTILQGQQRGLQTRSAGSPGTGRGGPPARGQGSGDFLPDQVLWRSKFGQRIHLQFCERGPGRRSGPQRFGKDHLVEFIDRSSTTRRGFRGVGRTNGGRLLPPRILGLQTRADGPGTGPRSDRPYPLVIGQRSIRRRLPATLFVSTQTTARQGGQIERR